MSVAPIPASFLSASRRARRAAAFPSPRRPDVSSSAAAIFVRVFFSLTPRVSSLRARRHCYATKSNKIRKLRLPGGQLGIQYVKKKTKGPQTPSGDHGRIHGVRPRARHRACF